MIADRASAACTNEPPDDADGVTQDDIVKTFLSTIDAEDGDPAVRNLVQGVFFWDHPVVSSLTYDSNCYSRYRGQSIWNKPAENTARRYYCNWTEAKSWSGDDCVVWQRGAYPPAIDWQEAVDLCERMVFDDHTDWRLPTIDELRSLIRGCSTTGILDEERPEKCGVHDDCLSSSSCLNLHCDGCEQGQGPTDNGCYRPEWASGSCSAFWSSSTDEDAQSYAWIVDFDSGMVASLQKSGAAHARCVRDQ